MAKTKFNDRKITGNNTKRLWDTSQEILNQSRSNNEIGDILNMNSVIITIDKEKNKKFNRFFPNVHLFPKGNMCK